MKLPLSLVLILPLSSLGQITLTSNDLPQAGTTYPLVDMAPPILSDLEAAGPNAEWDYSDVVPLNDAPSTPQPMSSASATALFIFNNPFNSSYQSDFFLPTELPDFGMDLGAIIPVDGFSNFYKTDGSAYTITGLALGAGIFDIPVPYTDRDELFPLPLEAGMTFQSTSAFALDVPETFGYWSDATRDVVVDGWGTLILPDGPHDVLRVKTEITAYDSIYIPQIGTPFAFERSQTVYQWYGLGHGFPLLEVNSLFGIPATARYLNLVPPVNSVEEPVADAIVPYPNPVTVGTSIQFTAPLNQPFSILDMQGRTVSQGLTTQEVTTLDAPSQTGLYVLHCGTSSLPILVN